MIPAGSSSESPARSPGPTTATNAGRPKRRRLGPERRHVVPAAQLLGESEEHQVVCAKIRRTVFDHVGLNVRDYAASRAFYEQALAPLGYRVVMAFDEWKAAGFGTDEKPEFWISEREPYGTGTHVAFTCADRATVDAFHDAALAAGGIDNGAPGPAGAVPPDVLRRVRARPRRQQHRGRLPHA